MRGNIVRTLILLAVLLLILIAARTDFSALLFPGDTAQSGKPAALLFEPDEPSCSTCAAAPGLIPPFDGKDYVVLNGNIPNFTEYDLVHTRGETYSELDRLGRCGTAVAMLDRSMMPGKSREYVNSIKPTGWHTVKYPDLIEERYLYNRCHLIAYAMTGQNENERNLITGTRYMNVESMLPFELEVLHYLDDTGEQVLYRVTPYFQGNELVARGVEMEAFSPADSGRGICFHVFVYNYQPGITIDYRTGESRRKS